MGMTGGSDPANRGMRRLGAARNAAETARGRGSARPIVATAYTASVTRFSHLRNLGGLDIVRVQSGQFAGQARISKCGRGLLRWALYHAAMGMARTPAGRARLAA